MASNDVGEIIKNITEDVKVLVKGEIELAKAELIPSGKNAGVGAGMFGGAGYLALNALSLIFLAISALFAWLFYSLFNMSYFPAAAIGLTLTALLLLAGAGILATLGKGKMKKVNGPERTVGEAKATVTDVKAAVDRGQSEVASGEVLERHLDAKALAAGSPRRAAAPVVREEPFTGGSHAAEKPR